ncbi:MAG TPA: VCBS repeat-containing protein, partial [Actinomycetota bacterium]|nr:VCBS repeat-containing protein [Actinomycetota bacterium]
MSQRLRLLFLVTTGLILAPAAFAQTSFTEVTPTGSSLWVTSADEDFWINAVAPADVDGDGDLDLAVLGFYVVYFGEVTDLLVIFENQGPDASGRWLFGEETVPLGTLWAGASDLAWGDYDNDGDPDLVVGSEGAMALYRNDAGTLAATSTVLPAYSEDSSYEGSYDLRSLTWADADNDGDLDLLVPSVLDLDTYEYSTKLLRNDGPDGAGGWTFTDAAATIDPTSNAQSAWADDDGDGDLDLLLVNVDPYTGSGFVRRYRNDAGAFTGEDLLGIRVEHGLADWGDYDGDGDLDILVAGNIHDADDTYVTALRTYRNDAGTFTETTLPAPNPNWLDFHAATWADYDSDGDVDLLVTGSFVGDGEIVGGSDVYRNDGGVFTPLGLALPAPVESIGRGGAFTWLDLDDDGDLDYLVAGAYFVPGGNGLVEAQIHLYRNGAP